MEKTFSVLVVEDAVELAAVFEEILMMSGLRVHVISDGAEAMHYLADEAPDLILLDMHLPKVSGLEILRYARTTSHLANTKIIAITGNPLLSPELEGDADLVLIKPFALSDIGALTSRFLSGTKTE